MNNKYSGILHFSSIVIGLVVLFPTHSLSDQNSPGLISKPLERFFPKSFAASLFEDKAKEAVEVNNEEVVKNEQVSHAPEKQEPNLEFQTADISQKTFLPPDQTPQVAINPEAPSSIISMIESNRRGDKVTAKAYAQQFVRVLQNYFFEVRQISSLIGDALIEEKVIEEEDWLGAEQAIDIELARTRLEKGVTIKPTNDVAMKRIVPDPKKEVQIFFIFSRSCSYCRFMAPDVERLNRVLSGDKRVKLTGLVVGGGDELWLNEFKAYTGLSIPVFEGTEFAKNFKFKFLPVVLIVLPNGQRTYFKSGQQSFERMLEFVRTAQGLPLEDKPSIQAVIKTPIGEGEKLIMASKTNPDVINVSYSGARPVNLPGKVNHKVVVEKF
ncbi:MAG TPA: hypothetical protein PKA63_05950 [Oligoflexia bacterium]|nr:hypothetical protein [Oligoflexia bacterium]HMP48193.1 hypothetical protein [Oligoflexia bacterium]